MINDLAGRGLLAARRTCDDAAVRRRLAGIVLLSLPGLAMLAGGIYELVVLRTGEPARARITQCFDVAGRYGSDTCEGMWVEGGSLVFGNGHVVTGTVDGATPGDLGKTIDVRLAGGRAYTTSLRIPIVLLVGGAILTGIWLWALVRKRINPPPPPGPAAEPTASV